MLVLVNLRSVWLLFISCYIIRYREPMPIVRKLNQNSEWDRMNCLKWKDELMDCLKWATLQGPHLRVFQDLKQPRTGLNHSNNVSSFFLILGPILGNEYLCIPRSPAISDFPVPWIWELCWNISVLCYLEGFCRFRIVPSDSQWFCLVSNDSVQFLVGFSVLDWPPCLFSGDSVFQKIRFHFGRFRLTVEDVILFGIPSDATGPEDPVLFWTVTCDFRRFRPSRFRLTSINPMSEYFTHHT